MASLKVASQQQQLWCLLARCSTCCMLGLPHRSAVAFSAHVLHVCVLHWLQQLHAKHWLQKLQLHECMGMDVQCGAAQVSGRCRAFLAAPSGAATAVLMAAVIFVVHHKRAQ